MKTLIQRNREEKEKFKVPHKVQDTIPIQTVWSDGIFLVGKDRYSKTFRFQDINYAVASLEDKKTTPHCSTVWTAEPPPRSPSITAP